MYDKPQHGDNLKKSLSVFNEIALNSEPSSAQPSNGPDISVVIPAYNEYLRLPPTLLDIINYFERAGRSYEVLVVDDGSTDLTGDLVLKFATVRPQIQLLRLERNQGKGNAVRTGMLAAKGARLLFADADGSTPIQELERLEKAMDEGADMVIASRALPSTETKVHTRWYRKLLGRAFNGVVNLLALPGIADTQCGFKLFQAPVAQFLFSRQKSKEFSFDVEILYLARKARLIVREVAVNWTNVPDSKVHLVVDALKMFRDIFRFRSWHRQVNRETFLRYLEGRFSAAKR